MCVCVHVHLCPGHHPCLFWVNCPLSLFSFSGVTYLFVCTVCVWPWDDNNPVWLHFCSATVSYPLNLRPETWKDRPKKTERQMWVVGSLTGTHIHDGSIQSKAKKMTFKSDSQVNVERVCLKTADCGKVSETISCAWGSKCWILHCAVNIRHALLIQLLHKRLHPNVPNPHYKLINRLGGKNLFE